MSDLGSMAQGPEKVLLMHISEVSGHRQAALAIQRSLKQSRPDIEAPVINGFGYVFPKLERIVDHAYLQVIKSMPVVWEMMYDNSRVIEASRPVKKELYNRSLGRMHRLFDSFAAQTVVCTQAFPCGMMAYYKNKFRKRFRLMAVLTDFAFHRYWINEGVDVYVVPNVAIRNKFVEQGVPPEKVKTYGIPVHSDFTQPLNRDELIARMRLDPEIPLILVMGGGQGLGPVRSIVKSLSRCGNKIQIAVLTGTNRGAVSYLNRYRRQTGQRILIKEYASNVHEFMELAAMVITKPGGVTTAEALTKGLPMVIVNPIPGQERRNRDFLVQNGIGLHVRDVRDIGVAVKGLLDSPSRMASMRQRALTLAKPYAADHIATWILRQPRAPSVQRRPRWTAQENYV